MSLPFLVKIKKRTKGNLPRFLLLHSKMCSHETSPADCRKKKLPNFFPNPVKQFTLKNISASFLKFLAAICYSMAKENRPCPAKPESIVLNNSNMVYCFKLYFSSKLFHNIFFNFVFRSKLSATLGEYIH